MNYNDELYELTNKALMLLSLGIDVKDQAKKLKSINNIITEYSSGQIIAYYDKNFNEEGIEKIKNELAKYDFIISFYNYCNKINSNLIEMLKKSKDEINIDELNSYINKIEDYLINLYNDKNNKVSNELLNSIYEVIYYLIKLEIIKTNKSTLYDFIKDKNIDTRYINILIYNDLNESNKIKSGEKVLIKKRLDALIPKLNKNSSNNDYFNIEIIKLLLMLENDYDAYRELEDDFDSKLNDLSEQDKAIEYKNRKINSDFFNLEEQNTYIESSKSELKKTIISTILTLSVILTGAFGIERGARKSSVTNSYSKETEIISELNDDSEVKSEEYLSEKNELSNEQYIDVLSPWRNSEWESVSRDIKEYDLTYLGLPKNIKSVKDIDIDNIKIEPNCYTETISKDNIDELQEYNGNIMQLRNISYIYQGKTISKENYIFKLFISYFLYILILIILELARYKFIDISFLHEAIGEFINDTKNGKVRKKELEEDINILLKYINQNKELREEFNKLFAENIDLLDDEEELKNRLNISISKFENYDKSAEMILKRKNEFL